jgi:Putative zinc-finger
MRLSCKEASRLLSLALDRRLTLGERTALRLHLALCDGCTRLKTQFEFLRRALASYSGSAERGEDRRDRGC